MVFLTIRVRGPNNTNRTLSIDNSTTMQELQALIQEEFAITDFNILYGFPPQTLALAAEATIDNNISNNETLRIIPIEQVGMQQTGTTVATTKKTNKANTTGKKSTTPKKATGVVTLVTKLTKKSNDNNNTSKQPEPFSTNVRSLNNISSSKSFFIPTSNYSSTGAATGNINQKRNLSEITNNINYFEQLAAKKQRATTTRTKRITTTNTQGDISEHLITAISGGTGRANEITRKLFRDQVSIEYNKRQAEARVSATYAGMLLLFL